jgi:hypothetical protein
MNILHSLAKPLPAIWNIPHSLSKTSDSSRNNHPKDKKKLDDGADPQGRNQRYFDWPTSPSSFQMLAYLM